jgi:hypothetical protein
MLGIVTLDDALDAVLPTAIKKGCLVFSKVSNENTGK